MVYGPERTHTPPMRSCFRDAMAFTWRRHAAAAAAAATASARFIYRRAVRRVSRAAVRQVYNNNTRVCVTLYIPTLSRENGCQEEKKIVRVSKKKIKNLR